MKELRRGLESDQWQAKSSIILNALRKTQRRLHGRGQAAISNFPVAGKPGNVQQIRPALALQRRARYSVLVRKRIRQMQLIPGLLISFVLIGLAVWWGIRDAKPQIAQVIVPAIAIAPFFIAGIAALIATLVARASLGIRMVRHRLLFLSGHAPSHPRRWAAHAHGL